MTATATATDLAAMAADPATFRAGLLVDTDRGPRLLGSIEDDWQQADSRATDPGWVAMVRGETPDSESVSLRAYLERPRGHDKTTGLAVMASWALISSKRRLSGVAAAASKDQARLLRDAIARLVELNGWLSDLLEVQSYRVVNRRTGSQLEIISADATTSWGLLPDFVLVDELAVWPDGQAQELWQSLFSAAAKRALCVLVVISNAGFGMGRSWNWNVREAARADEEWYFSRLDGPQASWITPRRLAAQERMLPPPVYRRVWLNEWTTDAADAYFGRAAIQPLIVADAPAIYRHESYSGVAVGVDIGTKVHHSAIVAVGVDRKRKRVRVFDVQDFPPPVVLSAVESGIRRAGVRFNCRYVAYDPSQMHMMAENLRRGGWVTQEVHPSASGVQARMAVALLEAIRHGTLELFDDGDGPGRMLVHDLASCRIVERASGMRVEFPETSTGHGDRLSALLQVLADCCDLANTPAPAFFERVAGRCTDL